jgi:zinc D-Ala-D-Ala carboxypeptidase
MKLSNNFSLSEFTDSNTAERRGIDNSPTAEHIHNMVALCENLLQPLRERLGKSIRISSGYRSEALNDAIGGSKTSEHSKGMAADIKLVIGGENQSQLLYNMILSMDIPFRQMIWEFGDDETPNWVHVSFNPADNKRQCLKAYKENGKTKYKAI